MTVTASSLERCPHCGAPDIVMHGAQVECLHCRKEIRLADLVACPRCGEVRLASTATCECGAPAGPAT